MRDFPQNLRALFTLAIVWLPLVVCFAQNYEAKGDRAWNEGRIKTAVNNYDLVEDVASNKDVLAKRGLGYFKLNRLKKAINDFTLAKKLGNDDPELFLLMAQTKQHLNEPEEAAFFYKEYIRSIGDNDPRSTKAFIELKNCIYSATNQDQLAEAYVQNFGPEINTYYDEIFPLQSPRFGNIYYFTSNRNMKDMRVYSYIMDKNGEWIAKKKFGVGVNSDGDDYVMDISPDGLSMLFVRKNDTERKHKILVSTFDDNNTQHIIELPDYLVYGAEDFQIQDRNSITFASRDLGGYGGYDIFSINYENGIWSDPINAGEGVNSEYDERCPYVVTSGDFIYYSSNRPYCFGGYDIYYYNMLGIKKEPTNLGMPINSAGNDLHYKPYQDGQMAVMSSDRKTGEGAYDIYRVYMQNPKLVPARDTAQLEYVRDYFDGIASRGKSHLDKLKEKLDDKPVVTADVTKPEEKVADIVTAEDLPDDFNNPLLELTEVKEKEVKKPKKEEPKKTIEAKKEPAKTPKKSQAKESQSKQKQTEKGPVVDTELKEDDNSDEIAEDKNTPVPNLDYCILYEDRHDLLSSNNKKKMDGYVDLLQRHPDYHLHFIAYTDHLEPGLPEFMQYNTIKRANLLAEYLLDNNIEAHQISIESVSNNYPLAKEDVAGKKNIAYLPFNKRIDIEIRDHSGVVLHGQELNDFQIPGYALDRKYELFSQIREEVYYSVEIANSPHIYKNAVLRLYDDIYIRKSAPTANNQYFIGIYTKYADAQALQLDLADSSAPYSKIVAFYNGMPLADSQLDELQVTYPDLVEYRKNLK